MNARMLACVAIAFCAAVAARGAEASEVWSEHCAKCHGPDGKGHTPMGKKLKIIDLSDAKVKESLKDEDIVKAIKEGRKNASGNWVMMPVEAVTDAEAQSLVKFIRDLKP